jgi:hypothetical protein
VLNMNKNATVQLITLNVQQIINVYQVTKHNYANQLIQNHVLMIHSHSYVAMDNAEFPRMIVHLNQFVHHNTPCAQI